MKTYNHAFTIGFSVAGSTDPKGLNLTMQEYRSALLKRMDDLDAEGVEAWHSAVDEPFDTYEEETEETGEWHYPYIRAWGRMLGSHQSYIEEQVRRARLENAPKNATYRKTSGLRGDGGWSTDPEIVSEYTRQRIDEIIKETGGA
jgi:hypothetical protein